MRHMSRLDIVLLIIAIASLSIVALRVLLKSTSAAEDGPGVELNKFISDVRQQFENMERERIKEKRASSMNIESFDLELNFVVKNKKSGKAEANYELVTIGGEAENATEKTQKITLHMKPAAPITGETPAEDDLPPAGQSTSHAHSSKMAQPSAKPDHSKEEKN